MKAICGKCGTEFKYTSKDLKHKSLERVSESIIYLWDVLKCPHCGNEQRMNIKEVKFKEEHL